MNKIPETTLRSIINAAAGWPGTRCDREIFLLCLDRKESGRGCELLNGCFV